MVFLLDFFTLSLSPGSTKPFFVSTPPSNHLFQVYKRSVGQLLFGCKGSLNFWVLMFCGRWEGVFNWCEVSHFWDAFLCPLNSTNLRLVSILKSLPSLIHSSSTKFEASIYSYSLFKGVGLSNMEYDVGQKYLGSSGPASVGFDVGLRSKVFLFPGNRILAPSHPFADPFIRYSPSIPSPCFEL